MQQALNEEPGNFKLLDARCATLSKLSKHKSALADAKQLIDMQPDVVQVGVGMHVLLPGCAKC